MVGISRDTLRHWRKVLSPLTDRNGYRPCFTLGDALALKVIKVITEDFGVAVGAMFNIAPALFTLCGTKGWALMENVWLAVNPQTGLLRTVEDLKRLEIDDAALLIPMGRLMAELRQVVMSGMEEDPDPQIELSLALGGVKSTKQ